ncbi:MAG: lamin tail domain-containing protein, partial [Phycisphaerae bacterium]|nr:lamin tail domain-containing protein [Phycisphaerae bacterium]
MNIPKANQNDVPLFESLEPRLLLSGEVLITEFMADNDSTLADENNDYSDWLEIHNYGDAAVDLEGWQLEDDDAIWTFPSMWLNPGQYRVIFASDKDRRDPVGELHTNFKLKSGGEPLALLDDAGTIVHEYDPYPQQLEDISYGVRYEEEGGVLVITEQYFTTPRPGAANVPGVLGMVGDTRFSADRGFYTDPVDVEITTDTSGAQIRYTLNGSKPTATTGTVYTVPIHVTGTTVLRAAAYKPGYLPTNVDTHTYIFLDDVLQQSASPAGFPTYWNGTSANYAMDPNVVNHPTYSGTIRDDMQAVPTVSIVTSVEDMFGSTGIYANPRGEGPAWERPASVEWINTDGSTLFQVDGGVQIVGGASRGENTKKHSFRLVFKSIYGPTTLDYPVFDDTDVDSFNTITLRAGFNDRIRNTLLQDRWAAERQLATGGLGSHGNFVHLYVDGLYWGLYNPVERPDDAFAASYLGGEKEDYDAYNIEGLNAGTSAAWGQLHSLANNAANNYAAIEEMLDIPDFCDYLIVNQFGSNWDWPQNNWWATYNREGEGKWRFHSWDAEGCLNNGNRIDQFGSQLGSLYQRLRAVPEFKQVFADRAHRHLFNDGVLTPQANIAWLDSAAAEIYEAVVGESARWGNGYADNEGLQLRDNWASRINSLRNNYFPNRTWTYINQLKTAGLYPNVVAPSFRINGSYQHGGAIDLGDRLSINASGGTIYYTLDGTDPATPGGTAVAYGGTPLVLPESTLVKARTLSGEVWSAVNEAPFYVHLPAEGDLIVTELNYHPQGPTDDELASQPPEDVDFTAGDFEFIELYNNGDHSIDLLGVSFSEGIAFEFGPSDHGSLAPGEFAVLVSNTAAFEARYGAGINVVGEYSAGLDSNGEAVRLENPLGGVLSAFEYNDAGSWPGRADGKGAALEIIDPAGDYNDPANWRSSVAYGGTPGAAAEAPLGIVVNEVLSHTDLPDVDSIELYNTTGVTVDIGGWYLSDRWGLASNPDNGDYKKFMIPPGTSIGSGEYLVFDEGDFNSSGGVDPLDFALSGAHGDDIWLMKADGAGNLTHFADHVDFGGAANGESFGRWPNAAGDLYPMALVTLYGSNSPPRVGPVVISEVMYNPPDPDGPGGVDPDDLEFIELYNPTGSAVELAAWTDNPHGGAQYLANWRLRGGVDMEFDEGTTIAAGGTMVVLSFDPNAPVNAARVADFQTHYGIDTGVPLTGGYRGRLDDDGERIELQRPDSPPLLEPDFVPHLTEDEVRYADIAPWPISPDGSGDSLHRVHFEIFGDYAGSWRHDGPSPGVAPVFSMPPVVVAPVDDVSVDEDSDASVRDVSGTFDDPDPGDTLTLSVGGNTNPGLVTTDLTAGILTLSYVANINGTANIAVRATDQLGAWTEDTLTVTVTAINDAPPTVTDHIDDVTVDEDTVYSIVHLPGVFDDVDFGDTFALSVTGNTNTDLVAANIIGTRIVLSYVTDENGTADITVRATDSGGLWVEDTFTVTVDPTNDAPTVVNPIADVTVDEDADDTVLDLSNVFGDIDVGDTLSLTVSANSNPDILTANVTGTNLTLSFLPDGNGTADITIRATDS